MAGLRVHVVMPPELVERVDAALPDGVSRGEFVRRAVERALGDGGVVEQASVTGVGGGSPGVSKADLPAPAEQPRKPGATSPAPVPEDAAPRRPGPDVMAFRRATQRR